MTPAKGKEAEKCSSQMEVPVTPMASKKVSPWRTHWWSTKAGCGRNGEIISRNWGWSPRGDTRKQTYFLPPAHADGQNLPQGSGHHLCLPLQRRALPVCGQSPAAAHRQGRRHADSRRLQLLLQCGKRPQQVCKLKEVKLLFSIISFAFCEIYWTQGTLLESSSPNWSPGPLT